MGANAQTSVPLFVANSVLTAAQQNISAATGVPVFSTSVTRDAAFGGSNKVLAEGQLCYLESTNVVQYYDGAAWASVGASGGMTLLSTTTLSGASTTISSINQTYVNLQIFITGMTNATSAATPDIQFNGSGSNFTGVELYNSNTSAGTGALTSTSFKFITAPTRTDANNFWGITIFNYASTTAYKGAFSVMGATRNAGGEASGSNFGYIKTNSAISSLVITNPGGNWSAGTVLIYGVK